MKKLLFITTIFFVMLSQAQQTSNASKFAETITKKDLKNYLTIVAGAKMEGRETATPGQKKAAAYIEQKFKEFGLKPGNGNSYQQTFPVFQDELKTATLSINNAAITYDKDFSVGLNNAVNGSWNINEVVFVSYGMNDSIDNDYNQFNVLGKWVVLLEATPQDIDDEKITTTNFRTLNAKINNATKNGAAGVIIISKKFLNGNKQITQRMGNMYMKKQNSVSAIPTISVSFQAAASILQLPINSYKELKVVPKKTYPTNLQLIVEKTTHQLESSNVVGFIEGTDKKDEYVVLSAHYDHLGKRDSIIYYGADDDGSGTVSVLEMAQAFAKAKQKGNAPRRTMVFITVSGEEKGLWGSDYYTSHPLFPLEKTSVDLNTDMVGRIDPKYNGDSLNYIYAIGEDKISSELMGITDSVNKTAQLQIDRKYNDLNDPNRFYYRSDHYNFAKNGVPIIFYFNGVHKDYHRPTDTVEKINFDLMEKRVRFIFNTAWIMANREAMIKRDLPLNIGTR